MLTFDDGPDPVGTPAVLAALAAARARATFFLVAPRAERHPELVARIARDGHAIGVHCDEHVRHSERDAGWGARDLARALARLRGLGVRPALWRLPWGVRAAWSDALAADHGLRIVDWSVDTHDWRGDDAPTMLAATRDDLRDGAVVLAHDGIGPGARRADARQTAGYVTLAARETAARGRAAGGDRMSATPLRDAGPPGLDAALARIAAGAAARDAAPPPVDAREALQELRRAGVLAVNAVAGTHRPPAAGELALVRRVAAADGSVGRIFDGHVNAVERIAVQAPPAAAGRELAAVRAQGRLLGVWGGEPVAGEGPPAALVDDAGGEVLRGVRTFCSGAGAVDAALVLARPAPAVPGPPVLVLVAMDARSTEIDESWYRSRGLVASMSHRVVFHDAPVLARLGGPGAIGAHPWLGRDALRTASSWAGMADAALEDGLRALRERASRGELEALAAGRMLTARHTIDVWLTAAATAMDAADPALAQLAVHGRAAIADACRTLLDEAARACGSRPFATAAPLDRARRDLEVFLLQHRLEPLLARAGAAALDG